ncbi:hypothetical protein H8F21_14650 [Pseudomonas sp. P66]|uniref:Uncharacterized protein n=1 Tax=Pseudomonas arcuscaelestis TaxID=2710591 RepID=A0ABS2BYV1_9PSED|nr:hypothetical protein [Pseudomonas arcuscaelestis]MBM5458805.1 hypothetical protein [Pseudomonas arcuscaelestis]
MRHEPFYSNLPVVRREAMELARLGSLSGMGPRQWIRFRQSICWLREASASVVFKHGGRVVREGGTYVDHRGYLTALSSAIASAERECDVYGVTKQSSMTISVQLTITEMPVVLRETPAYGRGTGNYYSKAESVDGEWYIYSEAEMDALMSARTADDKHAAWQNISRLTALTVLERDNAWSSTCGLGDVSTSELADTCER